jgi:hypothetical protein
MYEHASESLLPRALFLRRLAASAGQGIAMIAGSLLVGMLGYHFIERLSWIDAFLNASMLLGGEGPLDHPRSAAGKLFEGVYALYSGLAVITIAGVMFAPVVHRFLHILHREHHPERHPAPRP